jgi:hypothetical protein
MANQCKCEGNKRIHFLNRLLNWGLIWGERVDFMNPTLVFPLPLIRETQVYCNHELIWSNSVSRCLRKAYKS